MVNYLECVLGKSGEGIERQLYKYMEIRADTDEAKSIQKCQHTRVSNYHNIQIL